MSPSFINIRLKFPKPGTNILYEEVLRTESNICIEIDKCLETADQQSCSQVQSTTGEWDCQLTWDNPNNF